jgi:hypothetical protein
LAVKNSSRRNQISKTTSRYTRVSSPLSASSAVKAKARKAIVKDTPGLA